LDKVIEKDLDTIFKDIGYKNLQNKTFLISGATGFLVRYIIIYLLYINKKYNANIKVIGLIRNYDKAKSVLNNYVNDKNLFLIKKNLSEKINLDFDIHYIIHAASNASPIYYKSDPVGTILPNTIGTKNLLDLAVAKNIESFLFISSGEVYGDISSLTIDEKLYGTLNPLNLRSCYPLSKKTGEILCISYSKQFNLNVKIVRPFHVYGPGINLDDGRVHSDFIKNILKRENLIIKSDGEASRSFCYISEATTAIFKILFHGKNSHAYNLGNPEQTVKIIELAKILSKLKLGYDVRIEFKNNENKNYLKSEFKVHSPNIDKLKSLGWEPKINITEGFKKTIESFKEHEY